MSKYFVSANRPKPSDSSLRAVYDDWNPLLPSINVDDHVAVDTGLVDERGNKIMRAPNPVGFGCKL